MKFAFEPKFQNTVCPGSSNPFYIASLLYKMGHYFLDILYDIKSLLSKFNVPAPNTDGSGPPTLPKRKGEARERAKFES